MTYTCKRRRAPRAGLGGLRRLLDVVDRPIEAGSGRISHLQPCGTSRASGTFGVPHGDILFVCPEMLAHYVVDHAYLPPAESVAAIMRFETPGSDAYKTAFATFRGQ